jgi:hypothetical protein
LLFLCGTNCIENRLSGVLVKLYVQLPENLKEVVMLLTEVADNFIDHELQTVVRLLLLVHQPLFTGTGPLGTIKI